MLKSQLRRFFAFVTFNCYSMPTRLRDFVNHYLTRKSIKYEILKYLESEIYSWEKVAIVTIYPRKEIIKCSINLIDILISLKVLPLVVVNGEQDLENELNLILKRNVIVIKRPNIGRDFGAYKSGFNYLKTLPEFSKVNDLFFLNDSVAWGVKSESLISECIQNKKPWVSLLVNFQFHVHAQSFLLGFKKAVFSHQSFEKFWKSYRPTDLRHSTINKGEVKLSQILIKAGFSPSPIIDAKKVIDQKGNSPLTLDESFSLWNGMSDWFIENSGNQEMSEFMIRRRFIESNVSHNLGLLISRLLFAPLKLDLMRTGLTTKESISETLYFLGFNEEETVMILEFMMKQGTHASIKGIKGLWRDFGYV